MRRLQLSSLAMDDGGRCLLDVISDPLLLQSFLESDSENISKDHHNGGSMTVASSTVLIGCDHVTASGQLSSNASLLTASSLKPAAESMGFNCQSVDKQNLMGHITLSASNNTSLGVGVSVVSPATSSYNLRAFTPTVVSGVRHTLATAVSTVNSRHSSPVVVTSVAQNSSPIVHFATKSNNQGSPLVQSMPPPSPLQQTRSPLPPHTPSPIPVWPHSPSNTQQIHTIVRASTPNQVSIGHHSTVSQVVHSTTSVVSASTPGGNVIIPTSVAQKLQAQQLIYHSHQPPAIIPLSSLQQHQQAQIPQVVTTTSSVTSLSPVVQFIPTQQQQQQQQQHHHHHHHHHHHQSGAVGTQALTNAGSSRSGHGSNRSIQPKQPQQILPKPPNNNAVKQVAPAPPPPAPRTATVGVGISPSAPNPPVMISQNAPSVFAGPQGTILLNHMLPNMGQGPLLIQGMQGMQGMQFTLRPQATFAGNPNANQGLAHNGAQNNAALIAALQASSHQQQTLMSGAKGGMPGQHTIVIPSSLAASGLGGQNINLAGPGVIHSPGQGLLARPNIILAPRMIGPHQGFQFHQIQTNQGPMTIALAHGQTLSLPSHLQAGLHGASINAAGQVTVQNPMAQGQGFFHLQPQGPHQSLPGQSVFNQQAVQQNLLAGSVVTFQKPQEQQVVHIQQQQQATVTRRSSTPSQNQPSTTATTVSHNFGAQLNQHHDSRDNVPTPEPAPLPPPPPPPPPKSRSKANRNKSRTPDPPKPAAKMLNLADLLKESGIIPESTPPTSPNNQTNHEESETEGKTLKEEHHVLPSTSLPSTAPSVSVVQPPMAMQHGQPSIFQMSQLTRMIHTNDPNHPQLKLSVAPDGSIILQPPNMVPAQNVPQLSSLPQRFVTSDPRPTMGPAGPQSVVPVKKEPPPPVVTSTPASRKSKSHAALLARLNSPTVAVPSVKTIPDIPNAEIRMPYAIETYMKSIVTSTAASTVIPMNVTNSKLTKPMSSGNAKAPRKSVPPQVTTFQLVNSSTMPTFTTSVAPSVVTSSSTQTIGVNCINHVIVGMHNVRSTCSTSSSSALPTSVANVCTVSSSGISSNVKINNITVDKIIYSTSNSTCAMSTVTSTVTTTAPVAVAKVADSPVVPRGSDCHRPPPPSSTAVGTVIQVQRGDYQTSNNSQQSSKQTPVSKLNTSPPKICPHVQKPALVTKSACSNAVSVPKPPPQPINPLCDPLSRPTMFRHQLIADQDAAVKAHAKRFASVDEACRTLLAYHVYHTPKTTDDDFKKADEIYEEYAWELLERRKELFTKYQSLILKESMRSFPSSEAILVEKLFVDDETISLALDKRLAAEGKEIHVPPLSNPSVMAENEEASSSKHQTNFQESGAECSSKGSSEYKALKYELKTLQVKLHRPLKRDRVSSPTEDEPSNEPSMKRTIKPSKSPVSKNESRTTVASDHQATNFQDDNSLLTMGHKPPLVKNEVKYGKMENHRDLAKSFEHHHHQNSLQSGSCHSEDIIVKIREELNLSPIDHDDHDHHSAHDDFETATTTSGLADFELPVARTEFMSVDSPTVLSFVGETRLRSDEVNYDFGAMDSSSEWTEAYAEQDKKLFLENEAAVESILNPEKEENHDLDLSNIEELDKHLVRTENSFKRGAKEANINASLTNSKIGRVTAGAQSLLGNGDFIGVCSDGSVSSALGSDTPDLMFNTQVQSAIKSILGMQSGSSSENNSFSTTDGDRELISLLGRRSSSGGTSRVENEERESFSVDHSPIEYDTLNGDDNDDDEDDDDDDEDDDDVEEEEDEDEDDLEEDEDNDDAEDHDDSAGEGANGSVGSNYADGGSNPESDAALDEAVRSILL